MKSLTKGESVVIGALLASEPISERERIRRSGIPSRTFEGVRQRAYAEGWILDRYVPDPVRIGRPEVTFVVAQPFLEHFKEVEENWRNDSDGVVVWKWQETLLGVFMSEPGGAKLRRRDLPAEYFRRNFEVVADARMPHVPVYFDFEGAWSRIAELDGVPGYPHTLPAKGHEGSAPTVAAKSELLRVAELVDRPFRASGDSRPNRMSRFFLSPRARRLLATRAVVHRVFLDVTRVPPYKDHAIEKVALVQGELRQPGSAATLYRTLLTIRVLPFLFVTDGSKVLIGALSPAPCIVSQSGPVPSVSGILEHYLSSIEIVREPVSSLLVPVNHRYDRLLPYVK
jgi:hypothetical protein